MALCPVTISDGTTSSDLIVKSAFPYNELVVVVCVAIGEQAANIRVMVIAIAAVIDINFVFISFSTFYEYNWCRNIIIAEH
jgi:hypothetical protein